jgi:Zn-finger nucleic acid-binding protein
MTYRDIEHRCLDCGTQLEYASIGGAQCERCPACRGMWFEPATFLSLLARTPTAQHLDELLVHNDGSPRRPCLHCGDKMDIAWIDFLKLDQCSDHGVWLDPGELDQALASAEPSEELERLLAAIKRANDLNKRGR